MKSKTGSFLSLAIMLVVGVIFLAHPGDTLITAARIIGVALIVIGAIGIASQVLRKDNKSLVAIVVYAVEVVAGIIIMSSPAFVISLFPIIIGLIVVIYGVSDILASLQMKKRGMDSWKIGIIFAVISVILGILILCHPFGIAANIVRVIGIVLVYKAITGMFIRFKL